MSVSRRDDRWPGVARAAIVIGVAGSYLAYVFQLSGSSFWTSGIGDWMDPYFINALLEHWYQVLAGSTSPSSPPMYFPAQGTLGYSHGLILYAPFYALFRTALHPFLAYNFTLVTVIGVGIVCLHVVLRRIGLTFAEALVLGAFFFTSKNIINGGTGAWSQRASVFLIPPIVCLLIASWRGSGRVALIIGWIGGLSAVLLYTQDFYTAHFAFMLAAAAALPLIFENGSRVGTTTLAFGRGLRMSARLALVLAVLAALWSAYLLLFEGVTLELLGMRVRSHGWRRPLFVAALSALIFLRAGKPALVPLLSHVRVRWCLAVALGAIVGAAVFLWFYLDTYREHRTFPDDHLMNALVPRNAASWVSPRDIVHDLNAYDTLRPFWLVGTVAVLVWLPFGGVDRNARVRYTWFLLLAIIVLIVPFRFNGFSIWVSFFQPLPGFSVIRDPKRIIYLFELAAVLVTALLLARVPGRSLLRASVSGIALALLVSTWNSETFPALRPIATYQRWVARPIAIDRSCRSFFVKRGPASYSARSDHKWTLYGVDAVFVALHASVPTMNGYSAWYPAGWDLFNPEEAEYELRVKRWVDRQRLHGVCELDLEARTMRPFDSAAGSAR